MITYGTTSDALFVLSGTLIPAGVANRGCTTRNCGTANPRSNQPQPKCSIPR